MAYHNKSLLLPYYKQTHRQRFMKNIRIVLFFCAICIGMSMTAQEKNTDKGVYLAGVAASFTDTLVYITDVQYLPEATLNEKGLLVDRTLYSGRLKNFVEEEDGIGGKTASVFYHRKKKALEKKMRKIRKKYEKSRILVVHNVPNAFRFDKEIIVQE